MEVLTRLQQAGLTANAEKCEFEKDTIDILGHKVTASGVTPYPDRENTIKKHPCPTNTKQLQNFLGVINFYRRPRERPKHWRRSFLCYHFFP
jgi:hypothetical protein